MSDPVFLWVYLVVVKWLPSFPKWSGVASYINFHKDLIKQSVKKALDMGSNFRPIQHYFQPNNPTLPLPLPQQPSIPEHLSNILQPFL